MTTSPNAAEEPQTTDATARYRAIDINVPKNLKNIRVILLEPREPGNIGSVARAVKGMGLSQLFLVNPVQFLDVSATWYMAHGAAEIVENCCVVDTLEEALEGIHFVVGTTHRLRDPKLPAAIPARKAAQEIAAISQNQAVALLFGREDFGLSTHHISRCQLTASIPMATKNPSLNLAQAVQIFAYEILLSSADDVPPAKMNYAEIGEVEAFYNRVIELLRQIGVSPYNHDWETYLRSLRRVFSRTRLEERDIATLDMVFSTARRYIERLNQQFEETTKNQSTER